MNGKQVIKALEAKGFRLLRVSGSHHILSNGERKVTVTVNPPSAWFCKTAAYRMWLISVELLPVFQCF